jgi:hypothetical protein
MRSASRYSPLVEDYQEGDDPSHYRAGASCYRRSICQSRNACPRTGWPLLRPLPWPRRAEACVDRPRPRAGPNTDRATSGGLTSPSVRPTVHGERIHIPQNSFAVCAEPDAGWHPQLPATAVFSGTGQPVGQQDPVPGSVKCPEDQRHACSPPSATGARNALSGSRSSNRAATSDA